MKKVIVALSGGVDSAVSAYLLKLQGYAVEAVFMHNWDARDESGPGKCTLDADWQSVQKTCEILKIDKLHRLNFQSSYWQRVFDPIIEGYASGRMTPNPDILCNREIKFGDLFKWTVEESRADALATGHYARILENNLRQSFDISKDQTYFLSAVQRSCWSKTIFPLGSIMKSQVKNSLVREAKLNHLIGRKESMGICFVGKRAEFKSFLNQFIDDDKACGGGIVNLDTGQSLSAKHQGLSFFTLGQNARIGGVGTKLYVVKKCYKENILYVVDRQDHPALFRSTIIIKDSYLAHRLQNESQYRIFCSIRSNDKYGTLVSTIQIQADDVVVVNLAKPVYAPCPGQWAVFYLDDCDASDRGRLCLGGSPIIEM